ncbi:sulfite exporter TauE/SafE family protein [Pseudomaricurvus alkylphenolicus]|uniref:TSUP family transporter n=1 Tax=Pseudomaricurvus alkylphenolicus TaxID=1306991 RepID=UPI0014200C82|nr:sulfite exporter TauE/SafE family protein [Pseudomaricurvus alkylphenolicus]
MTLLVGLCIGLVLGLTGAGGSIFAVPLLMLLLGLPINEATGISLGAVCVAAFVGVLLRLPGRDLAWLPALLLALAGMSSAPVGRWMAAQLPEQLLLVGFVVMATTLALRMWRQADTEVVRASLAQDDGHEIENRVPKPIPMAVAGWVCGLLSGLFGVGGGFVVVPVLTLFAGLRIHQAVATSLFVIALVSASGFAFHIHQASTVAPMMLFETAVGSTAGILVGTLVATRVAGARLQKIFAFSVISLMALTLTRSWI